MELFGRNAETAELARLAAVEGRVIGLTGRTGVGTSGLLNAFAERASDAADVWLVDLSGATAGEDLLAATARSLGIGQVGAPADQSPAQAIAGLVRGRRVILALDDADGCAIDAVAVGELIARCPGLTIVIARAVPVDGASHTLVLDALPVPDPLSPLGVILDNPAVRLYADRAARADSTFVVDAENARDVAELCRLVGGLPLAIELAAARVRLVPPASMVRQMRDDREGQGLDLLASREGPHVSVRGALASARARLPDDERAVWELLSAFEGPFPVAAAIAVSGAGPADTLDALEHLVDLKLVEPRPAVLGEPVYDMLPIVRAFVRGAAGSHAGDEARREYLRGVLGVAASALADIRPSDAVGYARVLRRDLVLEAERLMDADPARAAAWLADCAGVLAGYAERARIADLIDRLITSGEVHDLPLPLRARVWMWGSHLLAMSPDGFGLSDQVEDRLRRARELLDEQRWPLDALQAKLIGIANFIVTGDLPAVIRSAHEGVALAHRIAHSVWAARFEVWIAVAAHAAGDHERAVQLGLSVLEHAQRVGDSYALVTVSAMLRTLPDGFVPADAPVPSLQTALTHARASGDILQESLVLVALTGEELDAGRPASAAHWAAERMRQDERRGWGMETGISLVQTALIAVELDDMEFAARIYGAVRGDLDRILRAMAPRTRTGVEAAQVRVTAALGMPTATRLVSEGAVLSTADAAGEAIVWLEAHRERRIAGATPQVARDAAPQTGDDHASGLLTAREAQVLRVLAEGRTNQEIADLLGISVKTVMHHSVAIYRKLDVRGRAEATAYAHRNGLLQHTA